MPRPACVTSRGGRDVSGLRRRPSARPARRRRNELQASARFALVHQASVRARFRPVRVTRGADEATWREHATHFACQARL